MSPLRKLHALLREAAREQFAGIGDDTLSQRITDASSELAETAPTYDGLWARQLEDFGAETVSLTMRGRHDRSRTVAKGLRLCMCLSTMAESGDGSLGSVSAPSRKKNLNVGPSRVSRARSEMLRAAFEPIQGETQIDEKTVGEKSIGAKVLGKKVLGKKVLGKKRVGERTPEKKAGRKKAGRSTTTVGKKVVGEKTAGKKVAGKKTEAVLFVTDELSPETSSHKNPKGGAEKGSDKGAGAKARRRARAKVVPERLVGDKKTQDLKFESPREKTLDQGVDGECLPAPIPLTSLPRVGPKTADRLAAKGIRSVQDLVYFIPRAYRDLRRPRSFAEAAEGDVVNTIVVVRSFKQGWYRGRYFASMSLEEEQPEGESLFAEARWFHPVGGLTQRVETGTSIVVVGTVKDYKGTTSVVHPELYEVGEEMGITVVYPAIEGVGQKTVERLCDAALDRVAENTDVLPELLPDEMRLRHELPLLHDALSTLHRPQTDISPELIAKMDEGISPSNVRLAFDELFFLQLMLLRQRTVFRSSSCAVSPLPPAAFDEEALRVCLPFEPTGAQWRVIREVQTDLGSGNPMLRLIQGDVGSGKTVVAFAAARSVISVGSQVAVMAPTELLADQHYKTLKSWCQHAGIRVARLTGSMRKAERNSLLALLAGGKIDLLVGTHALLVHDVHFQSLGLVVVDEQHRFGVEQRSVLREKGEAPHLLVMTATPIPRSLALTAFGELDVSVIDELPPGRVPSKTKLYMGKNALIKARDIVCRAIKKGERAFVVCPLVEASEAIESSDVEEARDDFEKRLPEYSIGLVHGRMSSDEKDEAIVKFRNGDYDLLVATTVIEVGIDVPDATVILVEHSERFGLAQLHQLRGRVGRGTKASYCFLHSASTPASETGERLKVMAETSDGFKVAERDLEIRGPGEVFGTQQSGLPRLRFADLSSRGLRLLQAARDEAMKLLEDDPHLAKFPKLRAELFHRMAERPVFAGESG